MNKIDKEIIREDLDFICDYINELLDRNPRLAIDERDVLTRITRRLNDISQRVEA